MISHDPLKAKLSGDGEGVFEPAAPFQVQKEDFLHDDAAAGKEAER